MLSGVLEPNYAFAPLSFFKLFFGKQIEVVEKVLHVDSWVLIRM